MATAVIDLDLEHIPQVISGLNDYKKAYLLLKYKDTPVGKVMLPVVDGCIKPNEYYNEITGACQLAFKIHYVKSQLGISKQQPSKPLPQATIAICTRDRTDDLKRCLDALMQLPDNGQEIVVIDNCPSNDHTQKLVEKYNGVRYIVEHRPGLNAARNRALKEARNDIVAFTDDDAIPEKNWLCSILENFSHPLVYGVTGLTIPFELETEAQELFEQYSPFDKGFQRKEYSSVTNDPLLSGHIGAGANMALRRAVIHNVGWFDESLDAGTPTQSGGDHEFFFRMLRAGFKIIYEPKALSRHRHRRTIQETHKAVKGYGTGVYAFWTKTLLVEKEWRVIAFPWGWFRSYQLPNLIRALLKRPGHQPLSLVLAELKGCLKGPGAYIRSIKRSKKLSSL